MSPSQNANRGVPQTIHLTERSFDEALVATRGLVMVDFWAEWCGPCRAIAPVLEELAEALEGRVTLMKVNVDENHGLAARYGIRSIPTIVFFKAARSSTGWSGRRRRPWCKTSSTDEPEPVMGMAVEMLSASPGPPPLPPHRLRRRRSSTREPAPCSRGRS